MTDIRNIISCLLLYMVLLSCTAGDDVPQQHVQQSTELLLSIGKTEHLTRQASDVIQDDGQALCFILHTDDDRAISPKRETVFQMDRGGGAIS